MRNRSSKRMVCTSCGHQFYSISAFDKHLKPMTAEGFFGGCYDPNTRGLRQNQHGVWVHANNRWSKA